MEKEYKLVLSNGKFYKEIILKDDMTQFNIGTVDGCNLLLDRNVFGIPFCVLLCRNQQNSWEINCDDNVYIAEEGIVKQITRCLVHGDDIQIKYKNNNKLLLNLNFVLNFEQVQQDYRKVIELDGYTKQNISVGGNDNYDICIYDELMYDSEFYIKIEQSGVYVDKIRCRYGLYINGNIVKQRTQIRDCDFISVLGCSFYYKDQTLRTTENSKISVQGLPCKIEQISDGNMLYPKFYRNTRVVVQPNYNEINVLAPPNEVVQPEKNLLKNLLPALGTLAITVVIRGVIGGGGTFVIFSVCTMGMGIGTTVASFIGDKRKYKKNLKEREEKYERYIEKKRQEIEKCRQEEKIYMKETYITGNQEYKMVMDFSSELFRCKEKDFDYLNICIGFGKIKSNRKIDYKKVEQLELEDHLVEIPEKIAEEYEYIDDVPIICNISNINALGIVGNNYYTQELFRNIVVDICSRHYHADVKIIVIANNEDIDDISWIRYLPHINQDNMRYIVCNEESRNSVFEFMYKILSEREEKKISYPNYVVFVLNEMGIKRHPVSRYIQNAGKFGFSFVFLEKHEERLPMGCTKIIRISNKRREGELIDSNNGGEKQHFEYIPLSKDHVKEIAIKLSPVYTEEVSLESSLVKNITLFELLNINNVNKLDLSSRWKSSVTEKSLAAPLGVNSKNEEVFLNLHEKAHGPHGLVAGTTGSGKSEILQSYILSMATLYHPHEVSFMIIDFKGGGMVNQFKKLPHLIGAITNIDGREIERSLKSIKAELRKRQQCFANADVNHIDAYIGKYKKGEVTEIIPHLIVIVDEFAELKAEQPEFMKELISAARIGRSLGVHLILATQKPAGQVNEQIWSNSKFKLCLKVQNKEDSNEVLKSPLAAEIKEPGRAYLQVGNNEIFELFQSAYSGAPADENVAAKKKEYYIAKVLLSGKREIVYKYKNKKSSEKTISQLKAIVKYISEYCENQGIKRAPSICLPSLPEIVFETGISDNAKVCCGIGVYDDPDNQYQGIFQIDFSVSNIFIVGMSQIGKTNIIQSIIKSISLNYSPTEVNMYAMDFGSMILKKFEKLNHVGGIAVLGEDEKIKNLFKLLKKEVSERKIELRKLDFSSYASSLESGIKPFSQILFFIDNFAMYKEVYGQEYEDDLLYLAREGRNVGISIIATATQTSGIGMKLLSNFDEKIALSCNDKAEYSVFFGSCRKEPREIPGRALMMFNKVIYEMQTFLAFEGEKELDRMKQVDEHIKVINLKYPNEHAKKIPLVPDKADWKYITDNGFMSVDAGMLPIGINYTNVNVENIDLNSFFMISLIGAKMPDVYNFIKNLFFFFEKTKYSYEAYVVDNADRQLKELCDKENLKYMFNLKNICEVFDEILSKLMDRHESVIESGKNALKDKPLIVMIINDKEINNLFTPGSELTKIFEKTQKQYNDMKILFVFTYIEDVSVSFGASGVLKVVKEIRKAIIYSPITEHKFFDIPPSTQKLIGKQYNEGDAIFLNGNNFARIKVITP